jgi:cysteine-rich repeat protein
VSGDGAVDQGEQCDDSNTALGDGCSADCLSNETCDNGATDAIENQACDEPIMGCRNSISKVAESILAYRGPVSEVAESILGGWDSISEVAESILGCWDSISEVATQPRLLDIPQTNLINPTVRIRESSLVALGMAEVANAPT